MTPAKWNDFAHWGQITTSMQMINEIRNQHTPDPTSVIEVNKLGDGRYNVTPYDTHRGVFLSPTIITCTTDTPCVITVDIFDGDIAF